MSEHGMVLGQERFVAAEPASDRGAIELDGSLSDEPLELAARDLAGEALIMKPGELRREGRDLSLRRDTPRERLSARGAPGSG